MSNKHIFIIYTGGTVGMKKSPTGFQPAPGFLTDTLSKLSEFQHDELPSYTIFECDPLLDSSDIGPSHWAVIASLIESNYRQYDGFIVIHGTDTMAYTASALSFMLKQLSKPVIFTGAQVPLAEVHTDARENLLVAMLLAGNSHLPEVCIYFNNLLLRGNRSHKIDSQRASAFVSPNYPFLAEVGTSIKFYYESILKPSDKPLELQSIKPAAIACLTIFPGIQYSHLNVLLERPPKAIILRSYGAGNAPITDPDFKRFVQQALDSNVVITNLTQCLAGGVDMQAYHNGRTLLDMGVISALDMTFEALVCKLQYLLTHDPENTANDIQLNFRGELTPLSPTAAPVGKLR